MNVGDLPHSFGVSVTCISGEMRVVFLIDAFSHASCGCMDDAPAHSTTSSMDHADADVTGGWLAGYTHAVRVAVVRTLVALNSTDNANLRWRCVP